MLGVFNCYIFENFFEFSIWVPKNFFDNISLNFGILCFQNLIFGGLIVNARMKNRCLFFLLICYILTNFRFLHQLSICYFILLFYFFKTYKVFSWLATSSFWEIKQKFLEFGFWLEQFHIVSILVADYRRLGFILIVRMTIPHCFFKRYHNVIHCSSLAVSKTVMSLKPRLPQPKFLQLFHLRL